MADDGITIISQTTAERQQETIELFEQIRPLLDQGMIYSAAVMKVRNISYHFNRNKQAWFRDLVDYGESQGYAYEDHCGKKKR